MLILQNVSFIDWFKSRTTVEKEGRKKVKKSHQKLESWTKKIQNIHVKKSTSQKKKSVTVYIFSDTTVVTFQLLNTFFTYFVIEKTYLL